MTDSLLTHRRSASRIAGVAILVALAVPATTLSAQGNDRQNELTLAAEPVAGSVRFLRLVARGVDLGIELGAGPAYAVHLGGPKNEVREWAEAYPVLRLRPGESFALLLSPIGIGAIIGDDFGTVYPSGQAGVEVALGRLRLSSLIRTVRIAGGNGTGRYRTTWIPVRVGVAFGR